MMTRLYRGPAAAALIEDENFRQAWVALSAACPWGTCFQEPSYTHPSLRGRGLYKSSLRQMLSDAAALPGTRHIYVTVLGDNVAPRRTVEQAGFQYQFSLIEQRRLGRATISSVPR